MIGRGSPARWSWIGSLSLALILTGCGGAETPSASVATAAPTAAPTEVPTATANPTEAPSAAVDGALCAVEYETCPIDAGTYRSDPFTPAFTFTVDGGWTNDRNWPDGGGISKGPGGIYWASGVSSGAIDGADVAFDSTIDGFTGRLRSFDGFTVTDQAPGTIGGVEAVVLDVETGEVMAPGLYRVANDSYNLGPGEKVRFYLLDMDGTLVTIAVEAWAAADFETVMAQSQPVLDSLVWD